MPDPGDVLTFACPACCGGSSSSSSSSSVSSSSGSGSRGNNTCNNTTGCPNTTYTLATLTGFVDSINCTGCGGFNGTFTLTRDDITTDCIGVSCHHFSADIPLVCNGANQIWHWDLQIRQASTTYVYLLQMTTCGGGVQCSWQAVTSDCSGVPSGGFTRLTCNPPTCGIPGAFHPPWTLT